MAPCPVSGAKPYGNHQRRPRHGSGVFECSFRSLFNRKQSSTDPAVSPTASPCRHSERLRSTWKTRRSEATLPVNMSMSNVYGHPPIQPRPESPLRSKTSMARLLGIRRSPGETAHTASTSWNSSFTAHSPRDASPGPSSYFSSTAAAQSSEAQALPMPGSAQSATFLSLPTRGRSTSEGKQQNSRRSSSSSELWGSPVTEEVIAMGLVRGPDDSESREEHRPFGNKDSPTPHQRSGSNTRSAATQHTGYRDNTIGNQSSASLSTYASSSATQLKPPTSKTLKRILKSSVGLKKLLAEQQGLQSSDRDREQDTQSSTESHHQTSNNSWDRFPVTLPLPEHSSVGSRADARQKSSPSRAGQLSDRSNPGRNEASLAAIGREEEVVTREVHEADRNRRQGAAQRAIRSPDSRQVPPSLSHSLSSSSQGHGRTPSTSHPYGTFDNDSGPPTPSEELPGWPGYAHYVCTSHDPDELSPNGRDTENGVALEEEAYPLEPFGSLLFSPLNQGQKQQGVNTPTPLATRSIATVKQRHSGDTSEDTHASTVSRDSNATSDKFHQYNSSDSSNHHGSNQILFDGTSNRLRKHSLSLSPPAPPPVVPLPPTPSGTPSPRSRRKTGSSTSTPYATPLLSLSPNSPSSPSTPGSPATPSRSRVPDSFTAESTLQNSFDSPFSGHKNLHRRHHGLRKTPSDGSLALSSNWQRPPQRTSSVAHDGPKNVHHVYEAHEGMGSKAYSSAHDVSRSITVTPFSRPSGGASSAGPGKSTRVLSTCEEDTTGEGDSQAFTEAAGQASMQSSSRSTHKTVHAPTIASKVQDQDRTRHHSPARNGTHDAREGASSRAKKRPEHQDQNQPYATSPTHSYHRPTQRREAPAEASRAPHHQHNRCVSHTWDEETEKIVTNFLLLSSRKRSGSSLTPLSEE